jgi:predicted Zn-dependent protease
LRVKKLVFRLFPGIALLLVVAGCYSVPVTGRSAMNLVDDKEVAKMSIAAFDELKSHNPISHDQRRIEQLNRVGERLSHVVFWDMPDADWEFVVFDVPQQINAFAMAGGKVGVFSGLYRIVDTDDELASVLAHEIAHVTAKHVSERLSRQMALDSTVGVVTNALGAYGLAGPSLAFDRAKEKEADYIGLIYMARAGYDPEASIRVLQRLEDASAGQPAVSALESTHPSNPERIQQLTDEMPKALKAYEESTIKPVQTVIK